MLGQEYISHRYCSVVWIGRPEMSKARRFTENAQAMAAHESPRTTKLYDRIGDEITLDEVEKTQI